MLCRTIEQLLLSLIFFPKTEDSAWQRHAVPPNAPAKEPRCAAVFLEAQALYGSAEEKVPLDAGRKSNGSGSPLWSFAGALGGQIAILLRGGGYVSGTSDGLSDAK